MPAAGPDPTPTPTPRPAPRPVTTPAARSLTGDRAVAGHRGPRARWPAAQPGSRSCRARHPRRSRLAGRDVRPPHPGSHPRRRDHGRRSRPRGLTPPPQRRQRPPRRHRRRTRQHRPRRHPDRRRRRPADHRRPRHRPPPRPSLARAGLGHRGDPFKGVSAIGPCPSGPRAPSWSSPDPTPTRATSGTSSPSSPARIHRALGDTSGTTDSSGVATPAAVTPLR
jgi:hypothetical protein